MESSNEGIMYKWVFHAKKPKEKTEKGKNKKINISKIQTSPNTVEHWHQRRPDYLEFTESQGNISSTEMKSLLSFSMFCKYCSTVFPQAIEFLTFFPVIYIQPRQHLIKDQLITTYRTHRWCWSARKSLGKTTQGKVKKTKLHVQLLF